MNKNDILEILNFDPLYEVEKLSDKHWSEFNDDENKLSLGLAMLANDNKSMILKMENDTYFRMSWKYFKTLISNQGFKEGYSNIYKFNKYKPETKEEVILYYHPIKKLIIWAQSYSNMSSVNGGKLYGYMRPNTDCIHDSFNGVSCSHGWNKDEGIFDFDIDVREGLFTKISKLEENSTFCNGNYKDRFLWFLTLSEDSEQISYQELTQQKIDQSTKECREILGR